MNESLFKDFKDQGFVKNAIDDYNIQVFAA